MDGSRPGRVQEVQTALLVGEREKRDGERECVCALKNYDINASSLGINASGIRLTNQT